MKLLNKRPHVTVLSIFSTLFVLLTATYAAGAGYTQVAGLMDLRTTFSDGDLDLESLVKLARERGFDLLFINDHDRLAMEYGLFPFRHVFKKRVERPSINKKGADRYLEEIKRVGERYPEMIVIPGSETAPFYFWTGSYFTKDLTAHNHERRILTVGLDEPEDYRNLPILHNGFSFRYFMNSLPMILLFSVPLIAAFILIRRRGPLRIGGVILGILSFLFILNTNPFRSSPFDQYHGGQGIAPYQLLIDYVHSREGLTFWNYPETRSGVRKLGPIFLHTPPYPEVLVDSKGYTGFAALYGDNITVTEPGGLWDEVLLQYCRGERKKPVWGVSTADFHIEGGAGEKLGNFPTVFLVRNKTREEILFAMRYGRMYACRGEYPQGMILNEFSVSSSTCEGKATLGEEIVLREHPRIHLELSLKAPSNNAVSVRLIRSGSLVKTVTGTLPMAIDYEDRYFNPGQKIYYRMDAKGCGKLVSNPVFVRFE